VATTKVEPPQAEDTDPRMNEEEDADDVAEADNGDEEPATYHLLLPQPDKVCSNQPSRNEWWSNSI